MALFSESSMALVSESSMAFFSEICVEVVAVLVTLVCVSTVRFCRQRSAATHKACKKVVEEDVVEVEAESETITVENQQTETVEVKQVAQRMASLLEQKADVFVVQDEVECVDKETEQDVEFMQVAERMAALFEDKVDVELDDFAKTLLGENVEDDVDGVDQETDAIELKQVAERMAALFEHIADVEVDDFAQKLLDERSDVSTECHDEVLSSGDDMDAAEWDDVSSRMGTLLKGLVESEYDSDDDQFLTDDSLETEMMQGARCVVFPKRSTVSAASILESYGVLGASSGTWASTNWR